MQDNASAIVGAYLEARSSGDAGRLAELLSENYKEIDAQLGIQDRGAILERLSAAPGTIDALLDMKTVGNVVRVRYQNGAAPPQPETRVFAISEGKIKLEVQVAPD